MQAIGDILRGTCGGVSLTLVGHPFDTIKVLLQTQDPKKPLYTGAMDCVRKTYAVAGMSGFYKGVTSPLAGIMAFQAVKFLAYGQSINFVKQAMGTEQLGALGYLYAGSIAQGLGACIEGPIDFYKCQLQKQLNMARQDPKYVPQFKGVAEAAKAIYQYNGIRGTFQVGPHMRSYLHTYVQSTSLTPSPHRATWPLYRGT